MIRVADIAAAVRAERWATLVMLTDTKGSTPAAPGAAMLVTPTRTLGTIGGGTVEHQATARARNGAHGTFDEIPLGPDLDQCCGGHMRLAYARFDAPPEGNRVQPWPDGPVFVDPPPGRPVLVYGAGHVGRALVAALAPLPFEVIWLDARAGQMVDPPPGVETVETPLPEAMAAGADPRAFHVVLTHSHALDLEIVAAVLARPHGYCGLIGSATKRVLFLRRLAERGLTPGECYRLVCPIGLAGLADKRPAVIAASVAADLARIDAFDPRPAP